MMTPMDNEDQAEDPPSMQRSTFQPQPGAEDHDGLFNNNRKYAVPKDHEPQPNQYSQNWGMGSMMSDREKQEPSNNPAHNFSVGPHNESLGGTNSSAARRGEGHDRGQHEDDSAEVLWPTANQRKSVAQASRAEQEEERISWVSNANR